MGAAFSTSCARWNRSPLDLDSDEMLAQIFDRGELAAWRMLDARALADAGLRQRMKRVVLTVPVPRFWLAAWANLSEAVDFGACRQVSLRTA